MSEKGNFTQEVLISADEIAAKVKELGKKITEDYKGKSVLLIGILKGSVPFMADLMREIDLDVTLEFMCVSSYGSSTKSSGVVRIVKDLDVPIEGRDVIIVEDIIDTGLTLDYLKGYLNGKHPASLKICAFLDKPSRRKVQIEGDYIGFTVEDKYIVGYGLDMDQHYRQLPYISWIKPE